MGLDDGSIALFTEATAKSLAARLAMLLRQGPATTKDTAVLAVIVTSSVYLRLRREVV